MNGVRPLVFALAVGLTPAALSSSLTVPIVLTSTGIAGSYYTSELTLTNRGTATVTLTLTYTAAFGGGSGTATDTLGPGRQRILPNAIDYLIERRVPIPPEGNRGGTLRIDFEAAPGDVGATVRTTTAVPGGRAGLCYSGIPAGFSEPVFLCGLRQSGADRSNVAVLNAGGSSEGSVVLRLTVASNAPGDPSARVLPDVTLGPGEFRQFSEVLAGLGLSSGHVKVERVSGKAPFYCYATIMNQETSDGSFVEPIAESALAGAAGFTLPVVVESPSYATELVLTNVGSSFKAVTLTYVASAIEADGSAVSTTVTLDPGEDRVIPGFVEFLRGRGGLVGPPGPTYAGATFVTSADGPTLSGVAVGARTSTPAGTGKFGLFYGATAYGSAATASAWLYGLRQDAENRANLAIVNTGEADGSTDSFSVDVFDGSTGTRASTFSLAVGPKGWTQVNAVLGQYAPGVANGYARVTRTGGSNPFVAYAVLNDGGQPGQRTGDGAFLAAVASSTTEPSCTYAVSPSSQSFAAAGGSGSVTVTAATGCTWSATSDSAWLTITSGSPGSGSGTVAYAVAANTGAARTGKLTVASQAVSISQSAATSPGTLTWARLGGPPGGLGYDIRHSFENHDVWYVTDNYAGIHMSTDRGQTWFASTTGITTIMGTALLPYGAGDVIPVFSATVDPHDSRVVWIGTKDSGDIYRSSDGGLTWEKRVTGIDPALQPALSFRGFTVDPRSSNTVYAMGEIASQGWRPDKMVVFGLEFDKTKGIVYRTTDAGAHWTEIWRGDDLARYCWIDPTNPDVLYVSTGIFDRESANTDVAANEPGGVGILKSSDGGATWRVLGKANGLEDLYVGSLFMHPTDPRTLVAGAVQDAWSGRGATFTGGVFVTRDGGEHWQRIVGGEKFSSVEICACDPNVWYAASPTSVQRSDDNGVTWKRFARADNNWGPAGIIAGYPIDIQCDPDDARRLFVNNYLGGNYLSTDGGQTWTVASKGYTGAQIRQVVVARSSATRVYAGGRTGVFTSSDAGETWAGTAYPPAEDPTFKVNEIMAVALDPADAEHVLAVAATKTVHSKDGGKSWKVSSGPAQVPSNPTFAPSDPRIVYTGHATATCRGMLEFGGSETCDQTGADFHVSSDGGDTWQPAAKTPLGKVISAVAVDPRDPRRLLAASLRDGVLVSSDGGATFSSSGSGLPAGVPVRSLAIDPTQPDRVYAGLTAGLFWSTDFGRTWTQAAAGLNPEAQIRSLAADPVRPGVVYAGDWLSGVYVSRDGGLNWTPLKEGLVHKSVNSLAISSDGDHVYAGIDGDGVYRLDVDSQPPQS